MKPSRPRKFPATAGLLALIVAVAPGAVALQEQPEKKEKTETSEKTEKTPTAKASDEAKAKLPSNKGVVLRPKEVDGTVSAYAAAVRKPDPDARVFTNADLEKLWAGDTAAWATTPSGSGSSDAAPTPGPGVETPLAMDPLKYLQSKEASAADRQTAIADAERELAAARAQVASLEKQLLAIRNPFSARPELSEDEKEARGKDTSVAERIARTEEQLALARERVTAAEQKLARSRR